MLFDECELLSQESTLKYSRLYYNETEIKLISETQLETIVPSAFTDLLEFRLYIRTFLKFHDLDSNKINRNFIERPVGKLTVRKTW